MANLKISQLTAKGSNLEASDRIAIAQDTGGGTFASKYVSGAEVRNRAKNTQTIQYTLVLADANKVVELNFSASNNLIVPTMRSLIAYDEVLVKEYLTLELPFSGDGL